VKKRRHLRLIRGGRPEKFVPVVPTSEEWEGFPPMDADEIERLAADGPPLKVDPRRDTASPGEVQSDGDDDIERQRLLDTAWAAYLRGPRRLLVDHGRLPAHDRLESIAERLPEPWYRALLEHEQAEAERWARQHSRGVESVGDLPRSKFVARAPEGYDSLTRGRGSSPQRRKEQ